MWQEAYAVPQTNIWAMGCSLASWQGRVSVLVYQLSLAMLGWAGCWDQSEMSDKRSWPPPPQRSHLTNNLSQNIQFMKISPRKAHADYIMCNCITLIALSGLRSVTPAIVSSQDETHGVHPNIILSDQIDPTFTSLIASSSLHTALTHSQLHNSTQSTNQKISRALITTTLIILIKSL